MNLIIDIAGLESGTARILQYLLAERYDDPWATRDGETARYDDEALYEERNPDVLDYREEWDGFRREIRFRARFFSQHAEESLCRIFGGLDDFKAVGDRPLVREIAPGAADAFVWRARKAESEKELETIFKSPVTELGPPPSPLARNGRMNAEGITVFYGALDQETCVAEVRPPVGSHVVLAKFEVVRPLRLLDFDTLTALYVEGSHFDPGFADRLERVAFLEKLVHQMSRPVMPQEEALEYLPTQAVAEYLAGKAEPRLDGVIFRSTQTGNKGSNVVIFNHACRVELSNASEGTRKIFQFGSHDDEGDGETDSGHSIWITEETVPAGGPIGSASSTTTENTRDPFNASRIATVWRDLEDDGDSSINDEPSLRLNLDSVVVRYIERVRYDCKHCDVRGHRNTEKPSSEV